MPDILCKQCDNYISDPCVKLNALFTIKMDLTNQLKISPSDLNIKMSITHVDALLKENLGLENHQQHFANFVQRNQLKTHTSTTHLFWLKCVNGHLNQYSVTCNS